MTDLRGERVDEGKVWAACPRCKRIDDIEGMAKKIDEVGRACALLRTIHDERDLSKEIAAAVSKWIRGEG